MTDYDVEAWKDGRWWTFEIPALTASSPAGRTIVAMGQARRAADVAAEARDVIASWTEADEADVTVSVVWRITEDVQAAVRQAEERDAAGRAALSEAASLRRQAVRALRAAGLTNADTATVLGVSPQRVGQLAQ
jgi:DNA-directed RNA polymerase specialized sigma24 family protein